MTILSRNLGLFKLRVDNELNREQKCLIGVHQLQMSLPVLDISQLRSCTVLETKFFLGGSTYHSSQISVSV